MDSPDLLLLDTVIDKITIWDSAAHSTTLEVMLIGAVLVLPFLLAYTVFAYRVFCGKVHKGLYE